MAHNTSSQLVNLISRVERQVTQRLGDMLGREGFTVEQWRIISLLADGAGHTMSEVADFALLPAPTLTKAVDRLVSDSIVYRRVDALDRRRLRVFLTPRGQTVFRRLDRLVARHHDDLVAAAGADAASHLERLLSELVEPATTATSPTASDHVASDRAKRELGSA